MDVLNSGGRPADAFTQASRGSVIPLFHDQIKTGGPVTITTPDMTRFLLSLDQAVDTLTAAILKAPAIAVRGVKEYARTAYNMSTEGAIDFARNIHAVINSSSEIRRKG